MKNWCRDRRKEKKKRLCIDARCTNDRLQRFRKRRVGEGWWRKKEKKETQKDRGTLCPAAWYFIPYKRKDGTMAGTRKNGMKWDRGRLIERKKAEARSRQCEDSSLCKQCAKREWLKERWDRQNSFSNETRERTERSRHGVAPSSFRYLHVPRFIQK